MTVADNRPPLVGAPLWGGFVHKYLAQSTNPALAAWLRAQAGLARQMWEHATGEPLTDPNTGAAIQPCAPRNAMGLLGEHHAGAPFGTALVHPIYTWTCQEITNAPSAYLEPPRIIRQNPPTTGSGRVFGFDNDILVAVPAGLAYRTATVTAAIYVDTATASATTKCVLELFADGADESGNGLLLEFATQTTGMKEDTASGLSLNPGEMNRLRVRFYTDNATAVEAHLQALVIAQAT